jgi:hypothetical protein
MIRSEEGNLTGRRKGAAVKRLSGEQISGKVAWITKFDKNHLLSFRHFFTFGEQNPAFISLNRHWFTHKHIQIKTRTGYTKQVHFCALSFCQ